MKIVNRAKFSSPDTFLDEFIHDIYVIKNSFDIGFDDEVNIRELDVVKMKNVSRTMLSKRNLSNKVMGEVKQALQKLFDNKCAYCEQSFDLHDLKPVIDKYRPQSGLTDSKTGTHYPLHYLWLRNDWDNLYLCCPTCDATKSNRFPIAGNPSKILAIGDSLRDESPLILDPCDTSLIISQHLVFEDNGYVIPRTERGEVTIKLLGLNRPSLVNKRKVHVEMVENFLTSDNDIDRLEEFTMVSHYQFTELTNQYIERYKHKGAKNDYIEKTSQASDKEVRLYGPKITEITFKNIGPLGGEKTINISTERNDNWLMILGDNGSGKSTLLKLIALLLIGEVRSVKLLSDNDLAFNSFLKSDAEEGHISLKFSKGFPERSLTITRNKVSFLPEADNTNLVFNAYGSARLTPTKKNPASIRNDICFVTSLFDHFEPLSDVSNTLQSFNEAELIYAEESLASLFGLNNKFQLIKSNNKKEILFKFASRVVIFQQLSDGFKSIVTLFLDILQTARQFGLQRGDDFNGIVLIDELGTHLHPSWRMRIVKELRTLFPNGQFICTTHEPLCLRGLNNGEVVVLKREGNNPVKLIDELPPIEGLTSEQLLTSVHFGLNSTIAPEIEDKFQDYYHLLDLQERKSISPQQTTQLKELQFELSQVGALTGILGGTRRDQLVYHAIDKMVAESRDKDISEQITDNTLLKELSMLWTISADGGV